MGRTVPAATLIAISMSAAAATLAHAGAEEGKALYQQKCKVCHSVAGDAGKMADKGGALDGVGAKRDADWLTKYLRDPKSVMPDAKMPKMKMTDQELADYVAYLLTLK
jgi:mono/diheme cytochrome c family protein